MNGRAARWAPVVLAGAVLASCGGDEGQTQATSGATEERVAGRPSEEPAADDATASGASENVDLAGVSFEVCRDRD